MSFRFVNVTTLHERVISCEIVVSLKFDLHVFTSETDISTQKKINYDRVDLTPTKRDFPPTGKILNCYGLPRVTKNNLVI